jgi:hypothetical protein
MEETYIIILIIAVLILILYFVNFSGNNKGVNGETKQVNGGTKQVNGGTNGVTNGGTNGVTNGGTNGVTNEVANKGPVNQYKPYNPTEQFGNCDSGRQSSELTQITQSIQVSANGKASLKVHIAYWCGWSKKILQQLSSDEFKNKFKEVENICVVEIIDCEANKEKCDPLFVKGFPTIILQSKSGKMFLYNGDRSTDDLIAFIKAKSA